VSKARQLPFRRIDDGEFVFLVAKAGGEGVNMKKRRTTTKGTLRTMSWAELRQEVAWLKLKPGLCVMQD
jgi:hypothetical protein